MSEAKLYGLMAEFERPEDILHAARMAWQAGYRELDAYAPYPVEGLARRWECDAAAFLPSC